MRLFEVQSAPHFGRLGGCVSCPFWSTTPIVPRISFCSAKRRARRRTEKGDCRAISKQFAPFLGAHILALFRKCNLAMPRTATAAAHCGEFNYLVQPARRMLGSKSQSLQSDSVSQGLQSFNTRAPFDRQRRSIGAPLDSRR